MLVYVSDDEEMILREADELRSLKLVTQLSSAEALIRALAKSNSLFDGQHGWISIPWLRQDRQVANNVEWQREFDGVLEYAEKKGWLDSPKHRVRVHIEWLTPA